MFCAAAFKLVLGGAASQVLLSVKKKEVDINENSSGCIA